MVNRRARYTQRVPWQTIADEELDRLEAAAAAVCARHPDVVAAWLHGSAARGEPAEDLDVAVLFDGDPALFDWLGLGHEIAVAAGALPVDVDLRPVNGTPPQFRFNVVRDGRLLFERDRGERCWWEARAINEWIDFEPGWRAMRQAYLQRVASGG